MAKRNQRFDIIAWLENIDRRWIFLVLLIGVIVPFLKPVGLPVNVTPPTQQVYDHLDQLREHTPVLISFDYGPGSGAELDPMGLALAHHCFQKNLRVIGMTLNQDGVQMVENALSRAAAAHGKTKDVDWVNLGYKPGVFTVILGIGSGLSTVYPTNAEHKPFGSIKALEGVTNFDSIGATITLSSWASTDVWVRFAHELFGADVACGVTGVMVSGYYTYLQAGQIFGMLGGLKGAAEYERLVNQPGDGQRGMDSQSIAHFYVVTLVVLGNVAAIVQRRRRARA